MFEGLFQPMHLLVIGIVALVVFGPKRLPELGRGLGDGIREFKRTLHDVPANTNTASRQGNVESKESVNESIGGASSNQS
jgi:sec-independent protein translocase protein TatA